MLLGVVSFLLFQKTLAGGFPPGRSDAGGARLGAIDYVQVVAIAAICLGLAFAGLRIWPSLRPIRRPPGLGDGLTLAYHARSRSSPSSSSSGLRRPGRGRPSAGTSRRRSGFTAVEWQRLAVILVVGLLRRLLDGIRAGGGDPDPLRRPEDRPDALRRSDETVPRVLLPDRSTPPRSSSWPRSSRSSGPAGPDRHPRLVHGQDGHRPALRRPRLRGDVPGRQELRRRRQGVGPQWLVVVYVFHTSASCACRRSACRWSTSSPRPGSPR